MKRKNIFKSLLAAAMALIMIFGAAPLSGFVGIRLPMLSLKAEAETTEDGLFEYAVDRRWTESGYQDGVRITRCDKNVSGKVVIPETIEGYEVKWISSYAFSSCKNITEITMPDSVTEIGEWAFSNCKNLTELTIPDGVAEIGDSAFLGCKSLTEITVSPDNKNYVSVNGVLFSKDMSALLVYPAGSKRSTYIVPDSVTEIGNNAFSGCTSLSKVQLSNGLTKIGDSAFSGCTSLTEITVPDSVTEIGNYAFSNCKNITEITIPDSVTEIGNSAFYNCTLLSKVKLPNGLTKIGNGAFYYCENLPEITIPDSVTEIGNYAFDRCTSLSKVQLSNGLTKIGDSAFRDCKNITEITIPDSVTEIGDYAFYCCTSLSKVKLSNGLTKVGDYAFGRCENLAEITIPDGVTEIGNYAFDYCTSLSKVQLSNGLTKIGDSAFSGCTSLKEITVSSDNKNFSSVDGVLFSKDMSILLAYPAGNGRSTYTVPDSVTEIGNDAFYRCTSLSKVQLSNGLTKIGNSAFSGCINLTEITIPDSVTKIGNYAFRDCKSLTEITIPDSVTEIGNYAFDYCTSLSKVKLSNGLTKIGDSAFSDCKNLTEITIPDSVTEIGYDAFYYCTSLSKVKLPNSLTKIGNSAFRGCINLTDITISSDNKNFSSVDGVLFSKDMSTLLVYPAGNECSTYIVPDSVTEIGYSAFYRCTSLSKVQLPNGLTKIGGSVFAYCKSLKELTIPDGVTEIGSSAFDNCTSLSKVKLSNSLTKIGYSAFRDCENLTEITIPDSVTQIEGSAFSGCTSLSKVDLPKNLTGIYSGVFSGCTSLTEITIPDSVISIDGSAFSGCTSIAEITVSPDNKNYVSVDGVLFSRDMSTLLVYPAGNERSTYTVPDGVTQIGGSTFSGCTSLTEITIPDSVISIDGSAFSGCTSIAEITVSPDNKNFSSVDGVLFSKDMSALLAYPKGNKRSTYTVHDSVTEIGNSAFRDCKSLTEITIPDGVTEIGNSAFYNCTSLSKAQLSNGVTKIGDYAFRDCENLAEITIPDSVTYIGEESFYGCKSLTEITVSPDNKNYVSVDGVLFTKNMSTLVAYPAGNERSTYTIPYGVKEICAFAYCENLKEIVFPDSVIDVSSEPFIVGCCSLTNIVVSPGNNIFWSADGVLFANTEANFLVTYPAAKERSTYTIPDSVEIIYAEAFAHSKNLKSVTISESVTAIYMSAFMCCTNLREITIPKSVIEIDDSAFENCDSLKNVYYLGTRAQWKAVVIGTKNEALTRATVHCIDDPPCDHVWGEWEVVEEATYEKEGLERRACSRCNIEETRVIPKLVRASAIELSESEKTVFVGDTFTITATVKPEDAFNRTVTWSSSDPSIATVDENGTVTAIAKGEAIITAESADGVKAECKVTVEKKVAAIELSESEKTVFVGDTFTITATVKPEDAFNRTVTWSSSDPSIATVDENGTVTAIAKGEAIITAESADGVTAECKVTVEKKDGFFKTLLKIITAPFRAIIYLFKKLFGK